ncbi:MAG: hypothetical protein KDE22_00890, partial [Rhodobacterales bacterium]|nr:hypothetical protein [Rhodobacterales bacterium]
GLLALAPLDGPAPWTPAWRPIHTRPGLLLAAFLLYLALLMRERLGPVAGWPAALFGRTGKAPEKALP